MCEAGALPSFGGRASHWLWRRLDLLPVVIPRRRKQLDSKPPSDSYSITVLMSSMGQGTEELNRQRDSRNYNLSCALYTFYDLELRALHRRLAEFQALTVPGRALPASNENSLRCKRRSLLHFRSQAPLETSRRTARNCVPCSRRTESETNGKAEYGRKRQMRPRIRTPPVISN
jgi:hypothetical protein